MRITRLDQNIIVADDFSLIHKISIGIIFVFFFLTFALLGFELSVALLLVFITVVCFIVFLPRRIVTVDKVAQTLKLQKNFLLFKTSTTYAFKDIFGVSPFLWESIDYYPGTHFRIYLNLNNGKMIKIGNGTGSRNDLVLEDARKLATFLGVPYHEPVPWTPF